MGAGGSRGRVEALRDWFVERGGVVLTNRRGGEITGTYPELAGMAEALAPHAAVLDGEVVTFNAKGQTSFQRRSTDAFELPGHTGMTIS